MINKIFEKIENIDFCDTFVIDDTKGKIYTYKEFFNIAYSYSVIINELFTDELIVVVMDNSIELMMLYFAVLFNRKEIAVIDSKKGVDEIHEIINDLNAKVLISDMNIDLNGVKTINLKQIIGMLRQFNIDVKKNVINAIHDCINRKEFLITFTSGTTGKTKGVSHSIKNLLYSAYELGECVDNIGNVFMHTMPMTYMAGILNSIIYPFINGMTIVLINRFSLVVAQQFWNFVLKYQIDSFWLSPSMLMLIDKLDRNNKGVDYCKNHNTTFLIGTAPLTNELRRNFENRYKITLYASYGLSETLFISVENNDSLKNSKKNCVGRMLKSVSYSLASNGELLVDVPWMFNKYVNVDTTDFFFNGFYRTGDLVRIEDGYLYIEGRAKDLIIKGGMKISPTLIENVIMDNCNVLECSVVAVNDNNGEERICCFYVSNSSEFSEYNLRKCVIEKLGKSYSIDFVRKLFELPKNINGKIDKNKLKELWKTANE